jgi:hypothetical protein
MCIGKDIVLVADYHAENIVYRWFNEATGQELTGRYPTCREGILQQVTEARSKVTPGGEVVWVMESTTGWARVKDLLEGKARFVLANVLAMPLPPKARRKKTDKIDTGRLLREYESGRLPASFTPNRWWREVRRLVDFRQDLVEQRCGLIPARRRKRQRQGDGPRAGRASPAPHVLNELERIDEAMTET